jgi:cytochrome c-type biogenesis protein CcmH/NrfG
MSYWRGLAVAVAVDLVWIMGSSTILTPEPWTLPVAEPQPSEVDALIETSERLDSLMTQLREFPEDVDAIEKVADIYADKGWWDAAIGPLARAIQLDPERWSLWIALDRAVGKAGLGTISDAELTVRAASFVDEVNEWGHGC